MTRWRASRRSTALTCRCSDAANADVDGLLAVGASLSYTVPGGRTYRSATRANDTLSTIALRAAGRCSPPTVWSQQLTAALLAEANQSVACLAAGGLLLVPPSTVAFSLPVTETNVARAVPARDDADACAGPRTSTRRWPTTPR